MALSQESLRADKNPGFSILQIHVLPGAKKESFEGLWHEKSLKIKLQAPPVDGEANKHLIKFLAKFFSLSRSHVEIIKGEKSRDKMVRVALGLADVRARLEQVL